MSTNTMIETVLQAADHASNKSDRWLFLAAILLMGIFSFLALRWLLRQNQRLIDDHAKGRDAYQQGLADMVEKHHSTNERLAVVIARNTDALDDCGSEIRQCREQREREARKQ